MCTAIALIDMLKLCDKAQLFFEKLCDEDFSFFFW